MFFILSLTSHYVVIVLGEIVLDVFAVTNSCGLSPRVVPFVQLIQSLASDMGVDLRCGQVGVTQ